MRRPKTEETDDETPRDPADAVPVKKRGLRGLKRKAGCILGLFTEPVVLLGATLLAVVFGRAYLSRRAERLRARQSEAERDD